MSTPITDPIVKIRQLTAKGIPDKYINKWAETFRNETETRELADFDLTALQCAVVNHPATLTPRGPNLVITGPTSSGKTLAAEFLIAHHLHHNPRRGCIYAVPLRALASEKFGRFQDVFGKARVYASSSDYQQWDYNITNTPFRIAVVVYEKLYSWLMERNTARRLLSNTGLLIIDELQMLTEPQRGAKLELILTFIRDYQDHMSTSQRGRPDYRIVGIGPSGDALAGVSRWLEAVQVGVPEHDRPVPLVEGYMRLDGSIHLEPLPPQLQSIPGVPFLPKVIGRNREELTHNFVNRLLLDKERRVKPGAGKRILVYCATKERAEGMARDLSRVLGHRQSIDQKTLSSLRDLESTNTVQLLRQTMRSGVGFHHGDLTYDERKLVEKLFRGGSDSTALDVIACTPTLAMGVNLPADYMLFSSTDTFRQTNWHLQFPQLEPLTALEYKNFAGRAGRYRPDAKQGLHGVALFMTDKEDEIAQRLLVEGMIRAPVEPIEPALHRWPFGMEPLVLAVLAWASTYRVMPPNLERIKQIFAHTFAGIQHISMRLDTLGDKTAPPESRQTVAGSELAGNDTWISMAEAGSWSLQQLAQTHKDVVVELPDLADIILQPVGTVVAQQGIHIKTYEILQSLAAQLPQVLDDPLVVIEALVQAPEVVRFYPNRSFDLNDSMKLIRRLREFFRDQANTHKRALGPVAKNLIDEAFIPDGTYLAKLMRTYAVWLWFTGEKADSISNNPMLPEIRYGGLANIADQLAWFMGALGPIWIATERKPWITAVAGLEEEQLEEQSNRILQRVVNFELRLRYGVPAGLEQIARLRLLGWHRERLVDLWNLLGGWNHPIDLLDRAVEGLDEPIAHLFNQLKEGIRDRTWPDDPRDTAQLQIALARQSLEMHPDVVSPSWPELIDRIYKSSGAELAPVIVEALRSAPFNLRASVEREGGSRDASSKTRPDLSLHLSDTLNTGVVLIGDGTQEINWSQIIAAMGRAKPDRTYDHVIIIADGPLEQAIEQQHREYGGSVLVLTKEALCEMFVRAVEDPLDDETPDSENERVPLIKRVTLLLTAATHLVFENAEEVHKELARDGGMVGRRGPTARRPQRITPHSSPHTQPSPPPPPSRPVHGEGVPEELYNRLAFALRTYGDWFEREERMHAIFKSGSLQIFAGSVPQNALHVNARIRGVVNHLAGRRRQDNGENALVILLRTLAGDLDPGDRYHSELTSLTEEVRKALG